MQLSKTSRNDAGEVETYNVTGTLRIIEPDIEKQPRTQKWISDISNPRSIIEKLRDFVDRFIIGSMRYCDVPRSFYAKRLPNLIAWLDESNKINYFLKKEPLSKERTTSLLNLVDLEKTASSRKIYERIGTIR